MNRTKVAILGSGNIGTDLMVKISELSDVLEIGALVGIDPDSNGLRRAEKLGVTACGGGLSEFAETPQFNDIEIIFDATSASIHKENYTVLSKTDKRIVDLTPAAIGPFVVPTVNLDRNLDAANVNMVTCGGQATIPIVHAISRLQDVAYAEIVASISSSSAGPGTRANIDEFTETTARAIESLGGARMGKAIIVLNPAEPPLIMRNTVYCLIDCGEETAIESSINEMVAEVNQYAPGYRLKQSVQFEEVVNLYIPDLGSNYTGLKVSVFLEIEGAGHYLPAYAGNLDIMTSAAMTTAERMVAGYDREKVA